MEARNKLFGFWEPKLEKMRRKEITKLQTYRLKEIMKRVFENNIFYRKRLKEAKIDLDHFNSIDDLQKIPFTIKDDLKNNYPLGLLSVAPEDVVRIHTSSGTTGNPIVVPYSKNDVKNWTNCMSRCLTMSGVNRKDVFQVIVGYGMFTGGLGFHYGAEQIGAMVVPSSTGNTRRQVKFMKDFGVTAFTSIPSYALYLAEVAQGLGINPEKDLKVQTISCGAEAWSEATRRKLEAVFDCPVFNSYGLAEVCGPGVAFECSQQNGLHLWEDNFIIIPNIYNELFIRERKSKYIYDSFDVFFINGIIEILMDVLGIEKLSFEHNKELKHFTRGNSKKYPEIVQMIERELDKVVIE